MGRDLAKRVGPGGRVLGLERSRPDGEAGRQMSERMGLARLENRQHDLRRNPLPAEPFDLVWCRWLTMFLSEPARLPEALPRRMGPGGRLLLHACGHRPTLAPYPDGEAVVRFGQTADQSVVAAGGEPTINRGLPSLLAARG